MKLKLNDTVFNPESKLLKEEELTCKSSIVEKILLVSQHE